MYTDLKKYEVLTVDGLTFLGAATQEVSADAKIFLFCSKADYYLLLVKGKNFTHLPRIQKLELHHHAVQKHHSNEVLARKREKLVNLHYKQHLIKDMSAHKDFRPLCILLYIYRYPSALQIYFHLTKQNFPFYVTPCLCPYAHFRRFNDTSVSDRMSRGRRNCVVKLLLAPKRKGRLLRRM